MFETGRTLVISSLVMLVTASALGEHNHRSHQAHQHGIAQLGVIQEDSSLSVVLRAPASDLVGFEHAATTKEELEALSKLETALAGAQDLFLLPKRAGCSQMNYNVEHALKKKHDHQPEEEGHAHNHSDSHDESSHEEIAATYSYSCENTKALDSMEIRLFKQFPSLEKIEASVITSSSQSKQVLEPNSFILSLKE